MTGRRLGWSADELAHRVMDAKGAIRHGIASAGLGARVATLDGTRFGVVVGLMTAPDNSPVLVLRVVWMPDGRWSQRAASATYRAYRAGLRESEDLPAAGLVAVEAWHHPDRARCVLDDPYHFGVCRPGGDPR